MQYLIKLTAIHTHSLYLTPSIIVEDSNFSFRFIIQKDVFFFFGFLFWVRVFVHTELASVGASRSLQFFFFCFRPFHFSWMCACLWLEARVDLVLCIKQHKRYCPFVCLFVFDVVSFSIAMFHQSWSWFIVGIYLLICLMFASNKYTTMVYSTLPSSNEQHRIPRAIRDHFSCQHKSTIHFAHNFWPVSKSFQYKEISE